MKKIVTFASLFIMCCFTAVSQSVQNQNEDRFVPSSPTVAELGKYGRIPVSHYTGIPNISIPIYTLQCGQLSLPITLSYHAGGIRVDQIASWVGLGWSLNAGGIISSSVMGIQDMSTSTRLDASSFWDYYPFPTYSNVFSIVYNQNIDTQPDIYSYNFMNYSGQFIQDAGGLIYDMKSNKQIKISRNGNTFKITDTNGTIYEFGASNKIEQTARETYAGGYSVQFNGLNLDSTPTVSVFSAWFLTSITSADGVDKLTFEYEPEEQYYDTPLQGKISYDFAYNNKAGRWVGSNNEWGNTLDIGSPFSYSQITTQTWRLTRIDAKRNNTTIAQVHFIVSGSVRSDFSGSKKLERISLEKVNDNGSNNNLIKQWDFNYGYFGAYYQNVIADWNHRLKLTSVVEDGQVTTGQKVYSFKYYGEEAGEPKMPRRLSYCGYDYWGYANASAVTVSAEDAMNVKKLFPNNISYTFTGFQQKQQCYWEINPNCVGNIHDASPRTISFPNGSNKAPDENYAKTYSLKELHYPTGGYSRFNYELNDYNYSEEPYGPDSIQVCGGLRIKSIEDYDDNGDLKERKSYSYKLSCDWEPYRVLSSGSLISVFSPFYERSSRYYPNDNCNGLIIVNQNTVDLSSSSHSSLYSAYGGEYIGYSEVEESDGNGFKRYKFYSASNFPAYSQSRYKMAWYNSKNVPEEDKIDRNKSASYLFASENRGLSYARGLIQSIDAFDTSGRIVSSESYAYNFEDTHKIYGMEVVKYPDDNVYFGSCHPKDIVPPEAMGYELPFDPRGYCFNVYYHQVGQAPLASKVLKIFDNTTDCYCTLPEYGYGEYEYNYPVSFLDDYKSYVSTWETYEYNDYNQPSRIDSWRSDGREETTIYKYPSDMIDNPGECNSNMCNMTVMQGMEAKFISPVIQTEKRIVDLYNNIDGNLVYADYTQYNNVSATNPNMYRPEKVWQLETESPIGAGQDYSAQMKEKVHYTKYNEYGKVSSLIADDQTPVVYLWSYRSQYPIAEIKGATYEQVRDALGGESAVNNLANSLYPNHTAINNLRTNPAFANARISTYTYQLLVGMLTATDPRGVTTYYQYDETGKLIRSYIIENGTEKTIQKYDYHYKN